MLNKAYNDQEMNSTVEVISHIKEKDYFSDIGMKDEYLNLSQILSYLTLPKSIPPYRKTDIIAFILFSAFYLCFNVIYFAVCINYWALLKVPQQHTSFYNEDMDEDIHIYSKKLKNVLHSSGVYMKTFYVSFMKS